jgi:hypothetical protein
VLTLDSAVGSSAYHFHLLSVTSDHVNGYVEERFRANSKDGSEEALRLVSGPNVFAVLAHFPYEIFYQLYELTVRAASADLHEFIRSIVILDRSSLPCQND